MSPLVLTTGLLSGLTYGLYSILGKPVAGRLDPAIIVSYALGVGAVLLLLAALPTLYTLASLSLNSYALLFMLAVVHTSLAFGLYTVGLRRLDAGQAAIVATVEPVAAWRLVWSRWRRRSRRRSSSGRYWSWREQPLLR